MIEQKEKHRDGSVIITIDPSLGETKVEEHLEQIDTTFSKKKQSVQGNYWCFTLNNYVYEEIPLIEEILKHECKWYIFQEETGELTGTPHLQGTICLKDKRRDTEVRRFFQANWDKTRKILGAVIYCKKYATRTGQIFSHGIKVPEPIRVHEPYGWQLEVINIINTEPDERTVHWFWEATGKVGKSALTKYLVARKQAVIGNGKANDIFHNISKNIGLKLFVCDVPRENIHLINYGAIEMVKNGLIFSGKFDSGQYIFNSPHVFVFANIPPDERHLSQDRWHIVEVKTNDQSDLERANNTVA